MGRLLGKLISTIVVGGAVAAGVAYALEKMEYKKDIKKDFDEFEGDFEDEDFSDVEIKSAEPADAPAGDDDFVDEGQPQAEEAAPESQDAGSRYVSLNANRDKLTEAAKSTLDAARVLAGAAIDMAKDMGGIVKEESGRLSGEMTSKFGQAAATAKVSAEKMAQRFDKAGTAAQEEAEACTEEAADKLDEACGCEAEAVEAAVEAAADKAGEAAIDVAAAKDAAEAAPASTVTISEE